MDTVEHGQSSTYPPAAASDSPAIPGGSHLEHWLMSTGNPSLPWPPESNLDPLAALALEQSQQEQLQKFMDAVPVGVTIHGADGRLLYLNQTAQSLLPTGISLTNLSLAEQALLRQLYVAGTETPYPVEQLPLSQALAGQPATADNLEVRSGNQRLIIAVQATPLLGPEGQVLYVILTFQDITTCRVAEDLLTRYSQELERQVQERTRTLQAEVQERQRLTSLLEQSEAQNRAIITAIPDLMFRVRADGIYLGYVRTNALIDLLPNSEDPVGKHFSEYLPPDIADRQQAIIDEALRTQQLLIYEQSHWINGQLQYEETRVIPSGPDEVLFIIRDITDRKRTEAALQQSESRFQKLAASAPGIIYTLVTHADGRVDFEYISPVFEEIFELPLTTLTDQPDLTFTRMETADREAYLAALAISRETLQPFCHEWRIVTPTGTLKWLQAHARPEPRSPDEVVWHGIILDVSDRKRAEAELRRANEQLEQLAQTDSLTQVANRWRFDQYLEEEWQRARREQLPLSLLLLDVDYFKNYNDAYGHQAGDQCLMTIAQTLQQAILRATDLVARYGGEEFAVILPHTDVEGAFAIATRIQTYIQTLHLPHRASAISDRITLSIGLGSLIPALNHTPDDLIHQTDQALYQAKAQGRNQTVVAIAT